MAQRLRFHIPFLARMQAATSTRDLWGSITNDAVFELQLHISDSFGRNVLLISDDSEETWQELQELIPVLDRATRVLSYALTAHLAVDEVLGLERWVTGRGDVLHVDKAVIGRILRHLKTAVSMGDMELPEGKSAVTLDSLVEVTISQAHEETAWSAGEFDAFISYKHRLYSAAAERLRDALTQRGLKVWLDRSEMPIGTDDWVHDTVLRRRLQRALSISRHTIFFETQAEQHVDEDFRGSRTAYNWQSFEHEYARDVIYINAAGDIRFELSPGPPAVDGGEPDTDFLSEYCRQPSAPPRRSSFGPCAGGEPDLDEAGASLRTYLSTEFGSPIEVSPLAEIAMLAPGSSDRGDDAAAYGGDVLIQLLRYDPAAALELARAGLNLYNAFAAGAKRNDRLWQRPGAWLVKDVFGFEPTDTHRRVRTSGRVGTRDLLLGILEFAAGNSFPRDVFRLALRAAHAPKSEDDLQRHVERFRTLAIEQLIRAERELDIHGWMIRQLDGRTTVTPLAGCGTYRPGDMSDVRVLLRQSERLFPPPVVDAFAQALAGGGAQHIDEIMRSHKEVARTLSGSVSLSWAQDLSRRGISNEIWLTPSKPDTSLGLFSSKLLPPALEWLNSSNGTAPSAASWPWGKRDWERVVLVTPPPESSLAEPMAMLDFVSDVLLPLDDYLTVRVLEYDDF